MARFASETELHAFLGSLESDYAQHAPALWQKGIRSARHLANFSEPHYLSCGLLEAEVDDIKAQAVGKGQALHEPDLERRVRETEARIAELSIQQNRGSQTTQTAQKVGALWMKRAHKAIQLRCLTSMTEDASIVTRVCTAVLDKFRTAPYSIPTQTGRIFTKKRKRGELNEPELYAPTDLCGVTVADLIPRSMETGFKEEDHLQPVLVDLIQAAMHTAECDCFLHDTHLSSNQLDEPASRPDCTLVAAGNKAMWTQVVSLWEFKIGSSKTETETMFGQQIERCRYALDSYYQRQMVVAVNITMNSLEVMSVERQAKEDFKLTTTGPQPFSISKDSAGFQLLVQVLSTAKSDLGFVTPFLPNINSLEGHQFTVQSLIKQGTAHQGSGSWVFSVKLGSGADAILKLNKSPNEGDLLSQLKDVGHIVDLLGRGGCSYNGNKWVAILVAPLVQRLQCDDDLTLFGQVLYDVAGAIANAANMDIAHRDITPNNFGHLDGRGHLYDLSAAKDMAGNWERPRSANILTGITGTVLWAPLSVLEGAQHSLSSMLEGLFISALSISCNGKLQLRHAMKPDQLSHCAVLRRGHLTAPKLFELKHIASHLQPLISSLHDLFYPLDNSPNPRFRAYDTTVTIDSVQGICRQVCGDLSP